MANRYCDSRGRFLNYISDWVFWVAGTSGLPVIAWLCKDWYTYSLVMPLLGVPTLALYW